ncbi:MAG: GcrA family cell cycle regulator [Sphingomonas sp.]|nr:GcrA family cell cycle regulator [Sphingomonas sp.]
MTPAERTQAVSPLRAEGLTATEIAARFQFVTRSAVLGLLHRNRATIAAAPERKAKPKPPPKPKPKPQRVSPAEGPRELPPEPAGQNAKPFLADGGGCKWPLWDRPDAVSKLLVCGEARAAGQVYCAHHHMRARGSGSQGERSAVRAAMKARL